MQQAPYGTWESPITASQIAGKTIRFFDIIADGEFIYNVEMRPNEAGRYVIVQYDRNGKKTEILPAPFSARTRVHEYGGRSFTVSNGIIYFINFADQNLYSLKIGESPVQITNAGIRFAEPSMTSYGLIVIAEEHLANGSVENYMALINVDAGSVTKLISGSDFYAFPTIKDPSAKSTNIAWISWEHPNMPWDATNLWVADLIDGKVINTKCILNGANEQSFYQPQWDVNGNLIFISDASGWWNPYIYDTQTENITPLIQQQSEFAVPLWMVGASVWAQDKNILFFTSRNDGKTKLLKMDLNHPLKAPETLYTSCTVIDYLCYNKNHLYFIGGSPTLASALFAYDLNNGEKIIEVSTKLNLPEKWFSYPQHIRFPTSARQKIAYAFFYPPNNPDYVGLAETKPPLVVMIHGGPTATASSTLSLEKQFWTTRGFAVVDVNYGGSTGYGSKYRKALQRDTAEEAGYWGDVDVKDCAACVNYLIQQGLVDPQKIVIRGGSAGGFTTLAALAFTDLFCAGTSCYGICDLLSFLDDTHKFESHYTDQLLGSYPKFANIYESRSPLKNCDKINSPLLVLQGDQDLVVPQSQSEMIVNELRSKGIRVEYQLYKGEQHGFRKAETIEDVWNRELRFYLSVFKS